MRHDEGTEGGIGRRTLLGAGLLAPLLPAGRALAACGAAGRVPLTETRRIVLDAATPGERWADISGAEDVAAMRGLAEAVMGDIRRKKSWEIGWKLATKAAYLIIYKPFGHYMKDSDHLARLVGPKSVSRADMAGLQRLYTLSHAGCSTVMAWDAANRRMVHFRSLDWPSADAIARASRLYAGQVGGSVRFSAAGLLGMVGFLTAVKPGFSVAINFAPWTGTSLSLNADPTFLVRQLMASEVSDYAAAHRAIAAWRPGAPVFISLCGVEKGEACIFEFGAAWAEYGPVHPIPMGDRPYLIQTNHYAPDSPFAAHNRAQSPPKPWDDPDWDGEGILKTSVARRALIAERLGQALAADAADLSAALHDAYALRPVWNHETAQWVEMVPQTGGIRAWVRG
jgi:hypothetical protein